MVKDKKRIEWIDLAKGFCIMLVVLQHVSEETSVNYPLSVQAFGFRMPLYFILSGLFFKKYEGFVGFLKRKTNKLLIPFLFFFLIVSVSYWALLFKNDLHAYENETLRTLFYNFVLLYEKDRIMLNGPIWFLLCLFEVNILFYFVQSLAEKISEKYKTALVLILSLIIGFTGLMLGVKGINIVFYLDTALAVLPFFAFGWWLFRHSSILTSPVNYKRDILIVVACGLIVYFCAAPVKWIVNRISLQDVWVVYLVGMAGTVMVLLVAKMIGRLPVISYWGKYSIMILCTHSFFVTGLHMVLGRYMSGSALLLTVFVLSMFGSYLLIPFMKRYMPHVTAQKDLIPV